MTDLREKAQALVTRARECADSLEAELGARYGAPDMHPAMQRRYERDIADVLAVREAASELEAALASESPPTSPAREPSDAEIRRVLYTWDQDLGTDPVIAALRSLFASQPATCSRGPAVDEHPHPERFHPDSDVGPEDDLCPECGHYHLCGGPPPAREPSDETLCALLHEYAERYRVPATANTTRVIDYADRIRSLFAPEGKP